jgi:anti-anti-sigma factor
MEHFLDPARSTLVVRIPHDILSTNVESLRASVNPLVDPAVASPRNWEVLELDLGGCRTIDSAGLNFVVSLLRLASARGARVRALVSTTQIHRIFQFTRLDKHVELVKVGDS